MNLPDKIELNHESNSDLQDIAGAINQLIDYLKERETDELQKAIDLAEEI